MESEMFYYKMQRYFDENIIREVYSSDLFSIACLGELCYVILPHAVVKNNNTVGIYASEKSIKYCLSGDSQCYSFVKEVLESPEVYGKMIYDFNPEKIDFWKKWIVDTQQKVASKVNPDLESEIVNMYNKRGR